MAKVKEEFNYIPEIKNALEYLASHHIEVGVFGEEDSKLLMIARVQEYGVEITVTEKMRNYLHSQGLHLRDETETINIPERSFVRAGFDANRKKFQEKGEELVKQAIALEITPQAALEALGLEIQTSLQEYLTNISNPPNSSFTVKQKGSSNPLIDTGQLRSSITYKIVSS